MKTEPKFERVAAALLVLVLIGLALSTSGVFLPMILPNEVFDHSMVWYMTRIWNVMYAVIGMFLNICIAIWLWRRSRMDSRSRSMVTPSAGIDEAA